MCAKHFGLTHAQLYGDQKEIDDKRYLRTKGIGNLVGWDGSPKEDIYWTPREIMQEVGSFYRKIDKDFWVKNLDKYIIEKQTQAQRPLSFVITDVRHINECEYVRILIKIVRPDAPEIHGMTHESETSLDRKDNDYYDILIDNNGNLEDLKKTASNLADALIKIDKLKQGGTI
jgi:hypothetical protein